MSEKYPYGVVRKYWRVLIYSIATFGIYYLFYQWWLFRNLEDHYQEAFRFEKDSFPTTNNHVTMFVFLFILPLYTIYVKYRLLHEHIATSKIETEDNCAEGFKAVVMFLLLGITTFGVVPLILEANWQKAFNNHILAHASFKN